MSTLPFDHALVALDQSDASDIMVDCLNQFQRFGTRKFTLFTSVSVSYPGRVSEASEQQYRDKIETYAQKLDSAGFDIENEVRFDINAFAPTEILNAPEDVDASMIVMGSQGHDYVSDLFIGGVNLQVIRKAHIPILTIPAKRE